MFKKRSQEVSKQLRELFPPADQCVLHRQNHHEPYWSDINFPAQFDQIKVFNTDMIRLKVQTGWRAN